MSVAADSHDQSLAPADVSGRSARPALLFIVTTLLALALTPILIQMRINAVRNDVEQIAEPARALVSDVQFQLAREMAILRGFLITGNPERLDNYIRFRAEEEAAFERLRPLARALDPEVYRRTVELERLADQWHERAMEDTILGNREPPPQFRERIALEQPLYDTLLESALGLELALLRVVAERQATIRRAERMGIVATALLVALALGAVLVGARLGRNVRRLAEAAEHGRREAERLMESKARLIRGITHDLKNPLGAADGYAQLLESGTLGELTPRQHESIDRMRRSLGSMLRIIEDLLELAYAEAGQLRMEHTPTEVAALVRETVEDHRAAAEAAGLRLETDAGPGLPELETDPDRVREIVRNLVTNAVKYTPPGGDVQVHAAVRTDGRAPGPGRWVSIDVADNGPGIPKDKQAEIFEEFSRLEPGTPGAGLGLAISRSIARLLGGEVTVESEPGKGSTFTLWLPAGKGRTGE